MKVWIVTIYEPLPFGSSQTRRQRCGMLAKALMRRGHEIVLWTSTFEHVKHEHYFRGSRKEFVSQQLSIQYLDGCGYNRDYSPKRFLHNRQTAREFTRVAHDQQSPPDIIFAPIPTLELAEAAVNYAKNRHCKVVVDIRDLWPDVYFTIFPIYMRSFIRPAFYTEISRARRILKGSNGITAISESYLNWGLDYANRPQTELDNVFHLGFVNLKKHNDENDSTIVCIKNKYNIGHDKFVFSFVGTFSDFYDIQCIFDAARAMLNDDRAHFLIVGSGENASKFSLMAANISNVTMTGWVDFAEVCKLLSVTDVGLVAYSKIATMSLPNKPFEYMASGIPLLSSLKGELENIILDYKIGRTYNAGDPLSLIKEIKWFLNNKSISKKMGAVAFNLYENEYNEKIIYTKLVNHLERIVIKNDH